MEGQLLHRSIFRWRGALLDFRCISGLAFGRFVRNLKDLPGENPVWIGDRFLIGKVYR